MRLGAFFGNRPAPASTPPATPERIPAGPSSRRSSIASLDMTKSDNESDVMDVRSEFAKWILPFFVLEHTEMAPSNRFLPRNDSDTSISCFLEQSDSDPRPLQMSFKTRKLQYRQPKVIKHARSAAAGGVDRPVDLTTRRPEASSLWKASYKVLHFKEDVRPPYQGTYTRAVSPQTARKLCRVPTHRGLPDTDYDYDSEAEWAEPDADDEDLEDEDDLSEEEDGADEMADFLDDEADAGKRAIATSDVEPVSTGLCWEGETALIVGDVNLADHQLQVMHDDQTLPIDPYSTDHWMGSMKAEKKAEESTTAAVAAPVMQPPRLPLANVSINSSPLKNYVTGIKSDNKPVLKPDTTTIAASKGRPRNPDKPVKYIPDALVPAFKAAVEGSDLNKIALVEILKKQFPSCSKDAIKGSLDAVAVRQGVKEVDKRWVLIA
jgi:chromatin assembly factor 1 subunit A